MMQSTWQLQEAKGNFSQLVKQAAAGEAQVVTVHGKPAAVVVSAEQYARLTRRKGRLSSALLQHDLAIDVIDLARSRDTGRDIAL